VLHLSSAEYVSGKGRLQWEPGDPHTLSFEQISLGRPFNKYAASDRVRWELAYGRAAAQRLEDWPGVVITCNVPLLAMGRVVRSARRHRTPWIFWHQDVYSAGMTDEASRRLPPVFAKPLALGFDRLEAWCARNAGHVVAIGEAFTRLYSGWRVAPERVSVIPNWAPLEEIVPRDRENAQADVVFGQGRPESLRLLYAGSLGRKHNPLLLVQLLQEVRRAGVDAVLTVVSEGEAADDIRDAAQELTGDDLRVVGFQPAETLAETLATADVLVALLEPEAASFSIPSKVLSYMAAGRPIVGLVPHSNPAATDILDCGGFVAEPSGEGVGEAAGWIVRIADRADDRAEIGRRTRKIAEERFDPERITGQFEAIIRRLAGPAA
jgi:glycosyltransferase involved in cell wall biosynthesis